MKEPLNFRISDRENPERGLQFELVLRRKGATAAEVLRQLIDAYIRSGGNVNFPVVLIEDGSRFNG